MKKWLILILCAYFAMLITACSPLNNSSEIDISQETEYHGLTKEEYEDLQAQKARFEAMTNEEKQVAMEGGTVGCKKFIHLWFEESIDNYFIEYVGGEAFNKWINEHKGSGDCLDIYSFADEFELDFDTLQSIITENHLEEIYPLDKIKVRYEYFSSTK